MMYLLHFHGRAVTEVLYNQVGEVKAEVAIDGKLV